jgi:hypothetical protein
MVTKSIKPPPDNLTILLIILIAAIILAALLGCTKPAPDCDCATITRGYEPMEWYRLEWCNGDTVRIWVVSEAWQISDTSCWKELHETEL